MIQRFANVLERHGVYTKARTRQAVMALAILALGWTPEQLDAVCVALARGAGPLEPGAAIVLGLRRRLTALRKAPRLDATPPTYLWR